MKCWFTSLVMCLVVAGMAHAVAPVTNGLVYHLEADAITGVADAAAIPSWPATVGNDATIAGPVDPNFVANAINGMPAVNFSDDGYINFDRVTTIRTVFWVMKEDIDANKDGFMLGDGSVYHFHRNTGGTGEMWHPSNANEYIRNGVTSINGSPVDGTQTDPPTSLSIVSVVTTGNVTASSFSNDRNIAGRGWDGLLAELLIYDRPLNDFELNHVGAYLTAKYGLTTSYVDPGPYSTNLNPADGAVYVDPDVTLTWDGMNGTSLTYEVRIDTDNDLSDSPVYTTMDTSYTPGLAMNTQYWWRVDIQGGNQGIMQSFKTDGKAEVIDPPDGATGIEQDLAALTWREVNVSGVSYDVYFGTNDPPAKVDTVAVGSYAILATLDPNTLYHWRIDTVRGLETITGDPWTFTSGGLVHDPIPAPGSKDIGTLPLLTWQGDRVDTYIEEYNVYLGDTNPPALADTTSETSWQAPSVLADATTYYWKIVPKHGGAEIIPAQQPLWSFTTGKLVSHWPLDGDPNDIVGGYQATTNTSFHYATGIVDEAMAAEFYGDDPIQAPTAGLGTEKTNFTITCWEWSDPDAGGSGVWETIIGCGADNDGWGVFEFGRLDVKRYVLGFNVGGGYKYTPNDDTYLRGEWHFHAITYDASTNSVHWYVNGFLVNTYSGSNITLDTVLFIGNVRGLSQPFTGRVDDLKLYSRPLSEDQIINEYILGVGGAPIFPIPASGARDVPWDVTLKWTGSSDAISNTIELGRQPDLSDATPVVLAGDAQEYKPPYNLEPKGEYYWRVTSTLPTKTASSAIWFFQVVDLVGDINDDRIVNNGDIKEIADVWLADSREYPPSQWDYLDQEIWAENDPNIADYVAYVTPGGAWGTSVLTVKKDPTPGDENYTPPSQTLLWTMEPDGQHLMVLTLPESVDFSQWDKFGYWVYQRNCSGNFQQRALDENGAWAMVETVYGMQDNNNKWYKYEWDIDAGVQNIVGFNMWRSDGGQSEEYGNFFLSKEDTSEKLCLKDLGFVIYKADLDENCLVNFDDYVIMARDWLVDARP